MRNKALVVGDAHLLLPFGLCGTGNSKTYLCVMHIQLPFSLLPALQLFLWLWSPIGCIFNELFSLFKSLQPSHHLLSALPSTLPQTDPAACIRSKHGGDAGDNKDHLNGCVTNTASTTPGKLVLVRTPNTGGDLPSPATNTCIRTGWGFNRLAL